MAERSLFAVLQHTLRSLRDHVTRFEARLRYEEPHGLVFVLLRDRERLAVIFIAPLLGGIPPDSPV